jgi:SAM-dependent methyltransferase
MSYPADEFKQSIYQDAARYDAMHWWKTDDIAFWDRMAREFGPRVLELAAGTGRLALAVLKEGISYTGVEISKSFLTWARMKLAPLGKRARFVAGDIRDFHLEETYDLIFIGFNSFLHLLRDSDARACLACVKEHCHENSRFALDIFVPDPVFLYRPGDTRVHAMIYLDPETQRTVKVEETNVYEPETEVNHIRWYCSTDEEQDFLVLDFTMRMYFPDTMDWLLHEAGFRIIDKWGDYDRTPFDEDSHLQIYVAQPA